MRADQLNTGIIYFHADWCDNCKTYFKVFKSFEQTGRKTAIVNLNEKNSLVQKHQVTEVPTFFVLKEGMVIKRINNKITMKELRKILDELG